MPEEKKEADPQEGNQQEENKNQGDLTSKETETQQSWWDNLSEDEKQAVEKEASERGFKSVRDFWKSYREAEKKISTQGQSLSKARNFQESIIPILRVIRQNPELRQQIESQLKGNTTMTKQPANAKAEPNSNDGGVRQATESIIVSKFESEHGIDKLDSDTRKEVRQNIGRELAKWVGPNSSPPVEKLEGYLEDAIVLARRRDERLDKMLSDIEKEDEHGKLPSHSRSGEKSGEEEITLTAEQKKAAEGLLGGDLEKYTEGVKKLKKTYGA